MGKVTKKVGEITEPMIESLGLELVDVEFVKEGEQWFLRIFIENPESETGIEDCELVSRQINDLLDEYNLIQKSYILEVSSPGLERPLKKEADFDRFKDHSVFIKTYSPINGEKEFNGKLLNRENQDIFVKTKAGDKIKIPLDLITSARLAIDFEGGARYES